MAAHSSSSIKQIFTDANARRIAGRFGMTVFLISLGVLFIATMIAIVVIRVQLTRDGLWPREMPALPWLLLLSTIVLIVSSGTMHAALRGIREGHRARLVRWLLVTLALGIAFLGVQFVCWFEWFSVVRGLWQDTEQARLALMGFYVLSWLHALHVVGGLIALAWTLRHARQGRYSADDHAGVVHAAMYWHFLDVVWVCLYAVLLVII